MTGKSRYNIAAVFILVRFNSTFTAVILNLFQDLFLLKRKAIYKVIKIIKKNKRSI